MGRNALLLIGSSPAALNQDYVEKSIQRWVKDAVRPPIVPLSMERVLGDPLLLNQAGAAWIILDGQADSPAENVIGLLAEKRVPMMLSLPEDLATQDAWQFEEAVFLTPPPYGPETLSACLNMLWHQNQASQPLLREMEMLGAQHNGACAQIHKMDEEMRLAAQLQRELLPPTPPVVHGIEFVTLFRPASYVSGDVYDLVSLGDDCVGIFLADAVGHGVPAAMMTVFILQAFRASTQEGIRPGQAQPTDGRTLSPGEAMFRINRQLIGQHSGKIRTATALYAVLDCRTHRLSLARAGHPAPLLLKPDGTVQSLEVDGPLLGVFVEAHFDSLQCQLHDGDRLLFYSDGFELAFPKIDDGSGQRKFFNPQFLEEFDDLIQGNPQQALEKLAGKLDQQIGSLNQIDDLTALMVGVHAQAPAEAAQSQAPLTKISV
ncbi:MAG: serine/threonine-protein phosphatase [Phycisphaeraceae bacterium]|nr:serine/threonine-protein phosphatase [Phycisphaeraceae bacterium]